MDWQPVIERYENELTRNVIPFWVKNCVDREYGGYFTMLDRDGSVYDTTKYMWMQWRIVYMFAELYRGRCGEGHPEYLEIARQGFDFLFEHGPHRGRQLLFCAESLKASRHGAVQHLFGLLCGDGSRGDVCRDR